MYRFLAVIYIVLAIAGPARAGINATTEAYQAEIKTMEAVQEARWGSRTARATLQKAFEAGQVGWAQYYLTSWSGWLWLDWNDTEEVYSLAHRRLFDWYFAVADGQADAAQVEAMLERGMLRLRLLHSRMPIWFEDDLKHSVERARWLDRAREVADCCRELQLYYWDLADMASEDSIAPDYRMIGRIEIFPAVPEGGGVPALPELDQSDLEQRAAEAFAAGDAAVIRGQIREAEVLLMLSDDPAMIELAQVLRLLRERLDYAAAPVGGLLTQAMGLPEGQLRDAVFLQVQDELLDRLGYFSEILANSATSPQDRESMRSSLLSNAKRLAQLADDSRFKFQSASGASRLFAALSATSNALDAGGNGDLNGSELARILQDVGDSFPGAISPISPFSGPMGAVSAQLNDVRSGFKLASKALDGVTAAMGGDPGGVERAQVAARELREVLSPKRFVQSISRGFVEGVVNNVPFARSLYDWVNS
ncbi:MAG: hypothetical protein L3J21_05025 [Devosiaceae bacterium]|nr:hypothetical protein [Devosiaceae bacterium]